MVSLYYLKKFFSTNFKLFLFYSYSIIGGFMKTLNNANLNETVIIDSLNCSGKLHRRFLDLGIIPGTQITPVFSSIFNDTVAYEVRGSIIAIRNEDSKKINIL